MASSIHTHIIILIFSLEYSLSTNSASSQDTGFFDTNETLEGSGEIIVEQYRFVLPIRKRKNVEQSTEVLGDGSGNYAYEIGVREVRRRRDSSSSENISINPPGTEESRKRRDTADLKRVDLFSEKVFADTDKLRKDENLLDEAIRQLQTVQEGNYSDYEVSSVTLKSSFQFSNNTSPSPKTFFCRTNDVCHSDVDCKGGKCNGNFLATCNCNACLNFWQCYSDDDCGGFEKACNMTTHMCNCFGAFVLNGYSDTLDALAHLCNVKKCHANTASQNCFGLPCNVGRCECDN